ncbi:unnamed protein product [Bursaphelenchus xylophilus]|uniref:(pine wood nematode) hypothetical protein n=1 Tax=Bursaphelenchus xylophilus TaxID=6326 RepID=A0A1I7SRF3_BURXY|nr:unnamed protein product [Bursaphelenchus xylophilus]CAG9102505.1 unnamed protein product [Bursaphelenchus xylophilus]
MQTRARETREETTVTRTTDVSKLITLDLGNPTQAGDLKLNLRKRASDLSEWSHSEPEDLNIYDPRLWECFGDFYPPERDRATVGGRPFGIIRPFLILDRWLAFQKKRWATLGMFLQACYDWWYGVEQGPGQKYLTDFEAQTRPKPIEGKETQSTTNQATNVTAVTKVDLKPKPKPKGLTEWIVDDSHDEESWADPDDSDSMPLENDLWPVYEIFKDRGVGLDTDGDISDLEFLPGKRCVKKKKKLGGVPKDLQFITEDIWDRIIGETVPIPSFALEMSAKRVKEEEDMEQTRIKNLRNSACSNAGRSRNRMQKRKAE